MNYPENLTKTSVKEIKEYLASRIVPHLANGDIEFVASFGGKKQDNCDYPDGAVTLKTAAGFSEDLLHGLTASDINFESPSGKSHKQMLSHAQYYIDEVIDIPLINLDYAFIYLPVKESLFSRKKYRALFYDTPIRANVNNQVKSIAKLRIGIILDEDTLRSLRANYGKKEQESYLQLHIKGPASITGGKATSIGGRNWLEYYLDIFTSDCRIIGIKKDENHHLPERRYYPVNSSASGIVDRIYVKAGDAIDYGDVIFTLGEYLITSPVSGTVDRIKVSVGDAVKEKDLVAVIKG